MLNLIKTFFPSWNFFNSSNDLPIIEYRVFVDDDWTPLIPPLDRHELSLFFNARVNLIHACNNHLLQWLLELQAMDKIDPQLIFNSDSYKITEQMVLFFLRQKLIFNQYQFRIRLKSLASNRSEVILVSPVMECS